jgi:hypothetical protein
LALATLAVYLILTLAASAALAWSTPGSLVHRALGWNACALRVHSGVPCPLCFGTTTYILIWRGYWWEAARLSPFAFALFWASAAGLVLIPIQIVARRPLGERFAWMPKNGWIAVSGAVILLMFVNWIYLIVLWSGMAPEQIVARFP